MLSTPKAPYLGVAYYPEDWPEEEIERDIPKMRELGINCVRIGEFAWHRMEPEPGKFDFSFFHRVVDRMRQAGIAVVLGTPTATPPRWFTKMFPDALSLGENGQRAEHGGRRHCCSNNPHYNEYCLRIVERMAKEFGSDPGVVGWQIDNEIYTGNMGCFCPDCVARFRERLREKFGDVDALNRAWGHDIFSQWYDGFEDIPAPRNAWHNPHLRMAWQTFQNDSHIGFVARQAEVLHRYVRVPVGTDTMPVNGMDYRRMTEKLDIVEFNHYNTPENLHNVCLWFDYLRTLKPRPFWNTETSTCWNGSAGIGQSVKPEGYCRANSWLPLALGGEANMYWLWRTHWSGHELMHGAVLDTSGRPMHIVSEVKETSEGFEKAARFLKETKVRPDLAIHFTSLNWNMFVSQDIVSGFQYAPAVTERVYKPLADMGVRPDVIDSFAPIDRYRAIISPYMLTLDEGDLASRMEAWVRAGGTWIVGPMTDMRNREGARYTSCLYGSLERLMGIEWKYALPDREGRVRARWTDGTPLEADTWFELSDPGKAESLATVAEGHSALVGKSVILRGRLGKGSIVLVGAPLSYADMQKLLRMTLADAGVEMNRAEGGVFVAPREGKTNGYVVVDVCGKGGTVFLPKPATDLLTGKTMSGRVSVEPYGVMVFEEAAE